MPRQGGPLENDESLAWVRKQVQETLDEGAPHAAIACGLLYVGDCIRIAVDTLIVSRGPSSPWKPCNEVVSRDGSALGYCVLPREHQGRCKCEHHLLRGE